MTEDKAAERRGVPTPVVWAVAALGLFVIGLVMWSKIQADGFGSDVVATVGDLGYAISLTAFVVSGAVIVSQQPRNIIGWLLMMPGLAIPASELIHAWLVSLNPPPVTADPLLWLAVWFDNWSWILLTFPIFHLLLTFPDGRLLSPRWRWVASFEVGMIVFMFGSVTFGEWLAVFIENDQELWSIENPIGVMPNGFLETVNWLVVSLGLIGLSVAGIVAFALRFRAGSPPQRQQLKWPLYAVAVYGVFFAIGALSGVLITGSIWDALFAFALGAIPISVAFAVLKYRLYDLDRIVSRTVTYLVVAVLLTGAFGLIVLGLGSFLGQESPLAVAAATLAVAALFNPVRTRIRRWVDRRFNRTRYDAQLVIDGFTSTLRDRVNADGMVEGWIGVVSETMQPATIGVWVRE